MPTTQQTIDHKIIEMIDAFREEFEKLTPEEKKQKQRINSLDTPCQIFIISSPSKISHLLIKTHLEEMPDKSINLVTLNNVKFIEELEEIHKKIAPFDKNEDENTGRLKIHHEVGRSIKNSLVNFGKQIMQGTEVRGIFPGIGSMILHDSKLAIWDIHGELDSFDFVAYGKKLPSEYKAQYEQQQKEKRKETPEQIKEITPNHKSGFGVYCYPPVLIGEFEPTIKERIENKEHVILSENVILDEFDGSDLVITKEGLLGLQTSSKKTADSVFHVIMGTSLLSNLPLHAHKISELADLSFDITTKKISSSSWIESSLRNQQFRFDRFTPFPKPIVRLKISIEDMISIIQKSKEIWKAESNLENLKLILGAMTYLSNQEFSQSFILSWTIIEKHVYDLWEKKLTKSKISNQRIKSMSEWDLYRITEILHLDRTLSDDDYSEIGYLRGLRNGLFHDGQEVTLKQSTRCFEMAYEITSKQFNINKKIKFQEYLSF